MDVCAQAHFLPDQTPARAGRVVYDTHFFIVPGSCIRFVPVWRACKSIADHGETLVPFHVAGALEELVEDGIQDIL